MQLNANLLLIANIIRDIYCRIVSDLIRTHGPLMSRRQAGSVSKGVMMVVTGTGTGSGSENILCRLRFIAAISWGINGS